MDELQVKELNSVARRLSEITLCHGDIYRSLNVRHERFVRIELQMLESCRHVWMAESKRLSGGVECVGRSLS